MGPILTVLKPTRGGNPLRLVDWYFIRRKADDIRKYQSQNEADDKDTMQTSEESKPDDTATMSGLFGRTVVGIIMSYFDESSPGSSSS